MHTVEYPKLQKLRSPQWRLNIVLSNQQNSHECPYIDKLHALISGVVEEEYTNEAYTMFYLPSTRAILDAVLLDSPDVNTLAVALGTTEACIDFYAKCFFDVSVFPNKLILREYILTRPENTPWEKEYKNNLKAAFSLGYEYILWKNSLDNVEGLYDPKRMSHTMLKDSYWRSREHMPFNISSDIAKESKSWVPQALRAIDKSIEQSNSTTGAQDLLRLRLVKLDTTVSRDEFPFEIKG